MKSAPLTLCLMCALSGAWNIGCRPTGESTQPMPDLVWGRQGLGPGRFQKPRAIAINERDELFIVDMTARIQVFSADGEFLRSWRTPESANGRPTGMAVSRDNQILVADTHYYRMLAYSPEGEPLLERTVGGTLGPGSGEFGFVTDVAQDSAGNYYIGEYGEQDRIQKFSPQGEFLLQWGTHGESLDQFRRPQSLEMDPDDRLWVADACNHRILVFDTEGNLLTHWGEFGHGTGQLYYPYDLELDDKGFVYVCEYGNERIQKFTTEGEWVATWGESGREPGQLHNPWAIELDSQGRLHVVDSNNHRVQRVTF